ncbi:hypothetical protein Glove_113g43 [Diversispora epigaea]|uniref:F-box domain-containing protein n=1 Tax=Diversispora epigaea TaxID=1348612 RepID=A0A397J5B2_9GLOM|nr:hypothetical protein Glove_113g43 [Diversispora epigaea]
MSACGFITINNIVNFCPKLEYLDIGACDVSDTSICNIVRSLSTNVSKDALSKLNPKLIVELERNMRGMAERFSLMVSMYGLKEKINYQPTNSELGSS